jgi:hypothetical protein
MHHLGCGEIALFSPGRSSGEQEQLFGIYKLNVARSDSPAKHRLPLHECLSLDRSDCAAAAEYSLDEESPRVKLISFGLGQEIRNGHLPALPVPQQQIHARRLSLDARYRRARYERRKLASA